MRRTTGVRPDNWWRLPSGNVVLICKIAGTVATVRRIDENGVAAHGAFVLDTRFIEKHGKKVAHD